MEATELTIDVVYETPYWVVVFEKVNNNRKMLARKRIGTTEPQRKDITSFFEKLNYKSLKYELKE